MGKILLYLGVVVGWYGWVCLCGGLGKGVVIGWKGETGILGFGENPVCWLVVYGKPPCAFWIRWDINLGNK